MKYFISKALFIAAFFISASLAAIDPAVQNQIKQKIQSLEQQKENIFKILQAGSKEVDRIKEQQQVAEKMKQPCGDFCKWRNEDFISLEVSFDNNKKPILQNMHAQIQAMGLTIGSDLDELMILLQKNGYTSAQLMKVQNSIKSIHETNIKIKESEVKCKDKVLQIDKLITDKKDLENQYNTHKDPNVKARLETTYNSLSRALPQWAKESDNYIFGILFTYSETEKLLNYVNKLVK